MIRDRKTAVWLGLRRRLLLETAVSDIISLLFDADNATAYDYLTRNSTRYCPVYKDTGAQRYALLPAHEAPRHGHRQWRNLADSADFSSANYVTWNTTATANVVTATGGNIRTNSITLDGLPDGRIFTVRIKGYLSSGSSATLRIAESQSPYADLATATFNKTVDGDYAYKFTLGATTQVGTGINLFIGSAGGQTFTLTCQDGDHIQLEDQTSLPVADQGIPNPYASRAVAGSNGIGWSRYVNGSSVASNVVTEADGALIPLTQRYNYAPEPELTQSIPYHKDFTNAAWTKSASMTAAYDATGVDGTPNGGSTLTAGAANQTAIYSAITASSGTHATKWYITRKTGTGTIELTTDNGATWQDITSSVSTSMAGIAVDQAAVTNPQIGIRIVTSGDAVYVHQAELFLTKAKEVVQNASPIPDGAGSAFTKLADTFESAALGALFPQTAGACLAKWRPSWAAADVAGDVELVSLTTAAGVLYHDDTNNTSESYDGTNTATSALTTVANTQYDIASYWGSGLNVLVDQTAGTEQSYDTAFVTDGTLRLHRAITHPQYFDSVRIISPQPTVAWIQGEQS